MNWRVAFGEFENWKKGDMHYIPGPYCRPMTKAAVQIGSPLFYEPCMYSNFSFGGLVMRQRQGFLWNYFWDKKIEILPFVYSAHRFKTHGQVEGLTGALFGVQLSGWIWILICGVVGGITYSFTRESHLEWNKINVLSPNSLSDLSQFISIKLP